MNSKKKYVLLIVISVLLLLLSYVLGFSKTLDLRKDYKKAKAQESSYESMPKQMMLLSKKQVYYDSILNKMNLGNSSLENNLLKLLSVQSGKEKVRLKDFNAPHTSKEGNTKLVTYNFTIEGQYTDLLKTIHNIEQNGSYGEVVYLDFQKEIDFRTRRRYLTVRVFVQGIQ